MRPCPLCHEQGTVSIERDEARQLVTWKCRWCREYTLWTGFAAPDKLSNEQRRILRGLSVERALRNESRLVVTAENLEALLAQGPSDPVEQADRFLMNLALSSSETGIMTSFSSKGHGNLAFADAIDASVVWLEFLQREGLIDFMGERRSGLNDLGFRLTLNGWRRVRELKRAATHSSTGFVAMGFRPELEGVWTEGVQPAFAQTGWKAVRADRVQHNERIDDWILNQIRAARFLIVETTDNNPGACLEAGFALGLGRPIVWVTRKDFVKSGLHFDIRQYNHLTWAPGQEAALAPRLAERILATVGQGSEFNPGAQDTPKKAAA